MDIEIKKEISEFYLTDISGKTLKKIEVKKNTSTRIDISSYATGIYFFRYKINQKWETGKIIFRK